MSDDPLAEVERLKALMIKRSFFAMFRTVVAPERLKTVMLDHYRWIIGLEKQGMVFASGPLFRKDGQQGVGMTVFRAASIDEAEALAAGDPFVTSGAAEFEIQRWQINEGRLTVAIDFSDQTYSFE
jgi:uncharacterized protein YciI